MVWVGRDLSRSSGATPAMNRNSFNQSIHRDEPLSALLGFQSCPATPRQANNEFKGCWNWWFYRNTDILMETESYWLNERIKSPLNQDTTNQTCHGSSSCPNTSLLSNVNLSQVTAWRIPLLEQGILLETGRNSQENNPSRLRMRGHSRLKLLKIYKTTRDCWFLGVPYWK